MGINLDIDVNNVEASVCRLADELMNGWILTVQERTYRIAEATFYISTRELIQEAGKHFAQPRTPGIWHIHKTGIDITIGAALYTGKIHIRALQNLTEPNSIIYGPVRCFNELYGGGGFAHQQEVTLELAKDTDGLILFEEPFAAEAPEAPSVGEEALHGPSSYKFLLLPVCVQAGKNMEKAQKRAEL